MLDATTRAAEAVHPSRGGGQRGGVTAEIEAITLDEAEAFRRAYAGAANARLIVAGHLNLEAIAARIKASFGAVPAGKPPELRPETGARVAGTLVMSNAPRALAVAVPIPAPKDPLYAPFVVLASRLDVLASRLEASPAPARAGKVDFDPLGRSDVLLVTAPIPAGTPAEPFAAKLRGEIAAVVDAPLTGDDADRTVAALGGALGLAPVSADAYARAPFETAFAAGRRAQLGVDGAALGQAIRKMTPAELAAATKIFDQASAAVIAGGNTP
jgi:hypothetical protein